MVWFNTDDGFYDHPKVKAIPRGGLRKGAICLWTLAGSWNARYHHDGLIPLGQIEELGGTVRETEQLVTVRLWHPPGYDCPSEKCIDVPPGYIGFHDWPAYQQTKEQVEARRIKARERQSRHRSQRDNTRDNTSDEPVTIEGEDGWIS